MSVELISTPTPVDYPDCDGKPMSDNTEQFRWIQVLSGNLAALYRDDPNVFVGGDLLWYPIKGNNKIRYAPDTFVVFGRPKGRRGSYKQWEENNIPITVAFEIRSPNNTEEEMIGKHLAYEEYGVEEYYDYDPETNKLVAYKLGLGAFVQMRFGTELVSPRLRIRFDFTGPEMQVFYPNGRPFLTFDELEQERAETEKRADDEAKRANDEAKRADDEAKRADNEAKRAADEAKRADDEAKRAADEAKRADNEAKRADNEAKRAARLGYLALKSSRGQLTPEEQRELETLVNPSQSG